MLAERNAIPVPARLRDAVTAEGETIWCRLRKDGALRR
jgi:hypothetical protein